MKNKTNIKKKGAVAIGISLVILLSGLSVGASNNVERNVIDSSTGTSTVRMLSYKNLQATIDRTASATIGAGVGYHDGSEKCCHIYGSEFEHNYAGDYTDWEILETIHDLNENCNNYFNDLAFPFRAMVCNRPLLGRAEANSHIITHTSVYADSSQIEADLSFMAGLSGDVISYNGAIASSLARGDQYVEVTIPFYVIEDGYVEVNAILYSLGSCPDKLIFGEWTITQGGNELIGGSFDGNNQQTELSPISASQFPYVFTAILEVEVSDGIMIWDEGSDDFLSNSNDDFTVICKFHKSN